MGQTDFLRFNTQSFNDCDADYNGDLVSEQTDNISPQIYIDKQALQQYRHLCREISELEAEKEALAQGRLSSSWQMSPKVNGGRLADPAAETAHRLWLLSQLLAESLNRLLRLRAAIEQAISRLLPEERRLLRLLYIQGRSAAECAGLLQYSERHFWRRHQRALERLAEIQGGEPQPQPRLTAAPQPAY